ncbi:hypothetical protein PB1_10734 [Bacillus methanolicus PB1]|uniref:DUF6385 domain-containing protein n=1 Tax=Bacillus methanolicus PB1 TaxID=997296 RepID=I3DUW4_BACMT|nr:DUF6385 domain-containing protein [Bacillus methanolicus]EIJ78035.1 hypothetical protein PB1_10734 [Bacillus methanolicus PB1]
MTNQTVFQSDPNNLRSLIFGRDSTATARALATDTSGNVKNLVLDGTISSMLGATITAGTLTSAGTVSNILDGTITNVLGATITAGTLTSAGTVSNILGGTITNVLGATITAGTLSSVTAISQKSFFEQETLGITTADAFTPLSPVTTSVLGTYSFFVYNSGTNPVNTRVEVSADGTHYFVDTVSIDPLAAGSVDVLVPARFLKYTRLSYSSATPGSPSTIDVIVNAQGT